MEASFHLNYRCLVDLTVHLDLLQLYLCEKTPGQLEEVCMILNLDLMTAPSGTFGEWCTVMERWTLVVLLTLVDPELLFLLFVYFITAVTTVAGLLLLRSDCLLFDSQHLALF